MEAEGDLAREDHRAMAARVDRGNRNNDGQGRPVRQGDSQNRGPRQGDGNGRGSRQAVTTSKDSKRERDRENNDKEKRKTSIRINGGGRRPNQGRQKPDFQTPESTSETGQQPKQEEKKPR